MVDRQALRVAIRVTEDNHGVIAGRSLNRDVAVADIAQDPFRLALERIPPTAAAAGQVAEDRVRLRIPHRVAGEEEVLTAR